MRRRRRTNKYLPYHICLSKTVLHEVFHDHKHLSDVILPVIAETA
jgi:hypothetical protein